MIDNLKNKKLLFSANQINERVCEMGSEISNKYFKKNPVIIGVLNGSFIFMADLLRSLTIDCEIDFIKLRSYVGNQSTGTIEILKDLSMDIKDRDIILVEDIIDTGNTVKFLRKKLFDSSPKSLSVVTLLFKPNIAKLNFNIDFIGFEISPEFVVGYGLDYNQKFRHLDSIYKINHPMNDNLS